MKACLDRLRVLDLSRILAGPWATQLLADLGAEVIKIERPGEGDDTRGWGPPFVVGKHEHDLFAAYYLAANRGKKSVAIDFSKPQGRDLVCELAKSCDVVVENFKVGGLKRLRLDYETLSALNPRLIYCSISGFGQTGPYKDKPGYDLLVQAMGGLMSITGAPDGEPMKVGVAVADIFTGLYATVAILASLNERRTSGLGQHIDLALLDVQIATLANAGMNYLASGKRPQRQGNAHANIVPYQAFATRDGHIVAAVGNDAQFARFAAILGAPELSTDLRFQRNADRVRNRAELLPTLTAKIRTWSKAELLLALESEKIPAGPINEMHEVFEDPHVVARGLVVEQLLHDGGSPAKLIGNPIRFSRTPIDYGRAPPRLGADTSEVLRRDLSKSDSEVDRLEAQGIVSNSKA
ncbi:CoA transferase [Bradyrhizobium tropiciagri]|uniref:CaiB/BaiF CoA transferase family protein n=1 Tax=Bradyrhizobium tropiciagri TaxID=312253 RepID=UPI001BAC9802|nr:CaiB/BaiF CoA-transferase family protein [Bradyrhizobium tropiciagri]MBR0870820.1 CoA transferase [Bradyrhizobium tropiciagri]